jgi:RimJ/RimL family protein N-acetyltransferase
VSQDGRFDDLQGPSIRLRAFEPEDWPILGTVRDSDVARRYGSSPTPVSRAVARAQAEEASRPPRGDLVELVVETHDGVPLGVASVSEADRRNGTFVIGGWLRREYWRRGFAAEAGRLLLRLYFHELGYQKAEARIHEYNVASLALVESLGFVPEGRRRRAALTRGAYVDELLYGLTREEFDERLEQAP